MSEDNQNNIEEKKEIQPEKVEESPQIKTEENQNNWKKFREEREKERLARIEAEKELEKRTQEAEAIKKAFEAVVNKKTHQDVYEYQEESDEERIRKMVRKEIEEETKKRIDEARDKEHKLIPEKLRNQYPDFGKVCNAENLDYLEYHNPEIANPYRYMPESYEKWEGIYKAIKKHVPYQNIDKDKQRIEHNAKMPQANIPAVTDTNPQSKPWDMTEERRKANWARMVNDMKNIAS